MSEPSLINSREVARLIRPLGLTMVQFAAEPDAPRAVLIVGRAGRGRRYSKSAVLFYVSNKMEQVRRAEAAQLAVRQALSESMS